MAGTSAALPGQTAATADDKKASVPAKRPPIQDPNPFVEQLVFTRRELKPRVQPLALNQVVLEAGPLKDAREWNRAYMLRIPVDRLLYNFLITAGLPSNAQPLGGWEAPDSELRGHIVGHYLSACALNYSATGDLEIKSRGYALVAGIVDCHRKSGTSGYVSAFPVDLFDRLDRREKVWAPFTRCTRSWLACWT